MKSLIAQFSEKRNNVSIESFCSDVLTSSELITLRGGGETYPVQEIPIIIPPGDGKKLEA